jgi:hypothetical protein
MWEYAPSRGGSSQSAGCAARLHRRRRIERVGSVAELPGPQGRLVYIAETPFFGATAFEMNADGSGRHQLSLPPLGLNGGVGSAASGFTLAYTVTVNPYDFPGGPPPSIRNRLPKLPPSYLQQGDFTPASAGNGGSFLEPAPTMTAYGRPAWSPDGTQLAYASGRPGELDIYLQPAGKPTAAVDITPNSPGDDVEPAWSPDGSTIAFASKRAGSFDLYAADAKGESLRRLTSDPGRERWPDWAPDGSAIVYSANAAGNDQLFELPAAGGAPVRVTTSDGNDQHPVWSPDGKWIAFSSDRGGERDIYLVDSTGGQLRQLTSSPTEEVVQDWQPVFDAVAPTAKALPSHGKKNADVRLRYRASDDSGVAKISLVMTSSSSQSGSGVDVTFTTDVDQAYQRVRPGTVYTINVSRELPGVLSHLGSFRFCVTAMDRTGNVSKASCAHYRTTG